MKSFVQIEDEARTHHPDLEARLAAHSPPKSASELADIPDDRWLSLMTRSVFQAGFVWKVIEAKWDGFEAAFAGFDPARLSFYADEDVDRLLGDARIVRNGQKIMATIANAGFVTEIAAEHGSFGRFLADWPVNDQPGLLDVFKKRGSRLAGMTGQYVLRFGGWDAWILSKDVGTALVRAGIVDKAPSSKSALAKTQAAFDAWREESGRSQSEISRILALSVG
ncbi:DNA-3-methyladenine glycosylase I [Maricaulis alexandrii]|uniref:DNA-3-methyladenine glycosylase I n=1 Tax=Maricaulis alexandrii TaxID=2570354 RepID=UPI001109C62D|nr:DNA-3-methyladenine glycosylase I [Maricaulis alexandrii]